MSGYGEILEQLEIRRSASFIKQKECAIDLEFVLNEAENYFNINRKNILSSSRKREFVEPRQFCYYVLRKLDHCLSHIGKCLDRDHSTIIYGVDKFDDIKALVDVGMAIQDDINIINKADEVITKIWLDNHQNKAA